MSDAIRILVVDDHPVVRDGLRGMLEGQPDLRVVGECANGAEAVARAGADVDVVLMDLRMPVVDGVAATAAIRRSAAGVQVLVLTTFDSDADILRAIDAGATGYLLKDAPREDLFRAIRAAARGEPVLSPTVAARLMGSLRAGGPALTEREVEVLQMVARGGTNREVGRALHVSEATVKTHLLHAYDKLGVSDRTAAVTAALSRGLITLDP